MGLLASNTLSFSLQIRSEQLAKEGWEYSPVFTMKFHAKERKMDLVRRRRWHRKMVQDDPSAPAVFHIDVGSSDDDVRITMLILVKSSATSFSHVNFFVLQLPGCGCFFYLPVVVFLKRSALFEHGLIFN